MEDGLRLGFWTTGLMRSMEWRVGGEGKGTGGDVYASHLSKTWQAEQLTEDDGQAEEEGEEGFDIVNIINIRLGSITWIIVFIFGVRI